MRFLNGDDGRPRTWPLGRSAEKPLPEDLGGAWAALGHDVPPVFAILGLRLGDDIRVLGAGTLVAPGLILTAGHVATRSAPESLEHAERARQPRRKFRRRYRVYSPWVGVKTVKEFHFVGKPTAPGPWLALAELESPVPGGLEPAALPESSPDPGAAWSFGFGGDRTGLLQAIPSEIVPCQYDDGKICLEAESGLGPGDSGAPVFAEGGDAARVISGVYAGLRWSALPAEKPLPERFAIDLAPYRDELEKKLALGGSAKPGTREDRPVEPQPDSRIDDNQYDLGAGEARNHTFDITARGKTTLVVTVNATILPLRSWPRMRVRLVRGRWRVAERAHPGPIQTIRRVGRNRGQWTVRVESESEIVYQLGVSLYSS